MRNCQKSGFTIIEILIFVSLISIIFIVLAQITIVSIQTSKVNEHKIIAQHLAESSREWLKGEKEIDFTAFITKTGSSWCFGSEPISSWPQAAGACSTYNLLSLFKRTVTLTAQASNTQVLATIVVEWKEGERIFQVPLKTVFALTE